MPATEVLPECSICHIVKKNRPMLFLWGQFFRSVVIIIKEKPLKLPAEKLSDKGTYLALKTG
jgi:hypothetical protein